MSAVHPPTHPGSHSPQPPTQPLRRGQAVAALVLSLCGFATCITAPVGLILACFALINANRQPDRYGGHGFAIGAIVAAAAAMFMWLALLPALTLPALARARELARRAVVVSNLREVGMVSMVYASQNQGWLASDPALLVDGGLISSGLLLNPSRKANGMCDFFYVVGLREDDPGAWLLAWGDLKDFGEEGTAVLQLDGVSLFLGKKEFEDRLQAFERDYQAARGEPPHVMAPF